MGCDCTWGHFAQKRNFSLPLLSVLHCTLAVTNVTIFSLWDMCLYSITSCYTQKYLIYLYNSPSDPGIRVLLCKNDSATFHLWPVLSLHYVEFFFSHSECCPTICGLIVRYTWRLDPQDTDHIPLCIDSLFFSSPPFPVFTLVYSFQEWNRSRTVPGN